MSLTNASLQYYDSNVLRLSQAKRTEYHSQVDNLISELRKHIIDQSDLKITKVVKAGSFAKYTILNKTEGSLIDVDVVFYVSGQDVDSKTLESLNDLIYELLIKIYPTKSVYDFEIQRRAATVKFIKSGLDVDVVPVIQDKDNLEYGWQYDIKTGERNLTCAPCHINFVRDQKNKDKHYRTLVRMAKRWKDFAQPKGLKSFHIELILAFLQNRDGPTQSIEKRFCEFLMYVAQTKLNDRIDFPENDSKIKKCFSDPVVIVDPANHENNVASRITEDEKEKIAELALKAWETAIYASVENDEEVWTEIFGNKFKIKD